MKVLLIYLIYSEEPFGRNRMAPEIEYLFSLSFPLAGNPSDLFGGPQERFWTSQNDTRIAAETAGYKIYQIQCIKNSLA
jgi:hypothetical protein